MGQAGLTGRTEKGRKMMSRSGGVNKGLGEEGREQLKKRRKRSALGQSGEQREVVRRGGGKEAWKKVGGRES